jgi:transmembrane sensor
MTASSPKDIVSSDAIAARARAYVVRLADPDVSAQTQAAFDEWLAADARHERAYLRALRTYEAAGALKAVFAQEIRRDRRITLSRGLWIAGGLTIAAACALFFVWSNPIAPATPTRFATAPAQSATIGLEDGSRVSLGPETALQVAFTRKRRAVQLGGGEAFFSVAKDASRPFIIDVAGASVEVLGTTFEVKVVCGAVRVGVATGVVRLRRRSGSRAIEIPAGRAVELGVDGAFSELVAARDIGAWRSGILSYDNASVCEIISDANRAGGDVIRLADPSLAELRITASYPVEQRGAMLASLESALPITIERRENGEIWLRRRLE